MLSKTAAVLLLLAVTATAQQQQQQQAQQQLESAKRQVIPAAASTATEPAKGKPIIMDFQQLGDCTKDTGLSPAVDFCSTQSALTKPGQAHWYRFNVLEANSAFTLHFLVRTQNGRVRMGLWFPGQAMDSEPSVSADVLLSSSFAQEQYITIPAQQLFHSPGIYMLQVMNEYGAPQYSLRADLTPSTTLLAAEDRKHLQTIINDCCPNGGFSMVCHMLTQAVAAESMDTDLCHQSAVQCDSKGHITDLVLQGANSESDLTCPKFSAGFAALPKLTRLDLAGANLGADLPTIGKALAPATQLKWLVLRTAGLQGELSCDIILPSVQLLSLTRNRLTGSIPECFTQPKGLLHLYLSDNALSGPLPDFSADSSLQLLFARDQFRDGKPSLGGSLPASLANARNLQYLQLSNTGLTGGIGELPANMKYLNLSANALEGPLPALPAGLVSLDFSLNSILGRLPDDMSAHAHLVDLQAFANKLQGPLPAKLPPNLVQLAVAANELDGELSALPRGMKYLSVAQNQFEGALPDGPGAAGLWFADFSSNKFTGGIPSAFSQSEGLVYLNVSRNQLDGIEAAGAWSTPVLVTLDISNNNIAGHIVPELAQQPSLAYINLSSNKLAGNLKPFAAALTADTRVGAVFDVSDNQLTGDIPEGMMYLAAFSTAPTAFPSWNELDTTGYPVKVFNVARNNLDGPFPSFLSTALVGLVAQHCSDTPGSCNMYVAINGGNNKLYCPAKADPATKALLPEDYSLLARQNVGCVAKDGVTYEISGVLQGKPVKLKLSEVPVMPTAQPREAYYPNVAAAMPGDVPSNVPASRVKVVQQQQRTMPALPVAAIAGIVAGGVGFIALVAVLGYVVVYRKWYTVVAAQSFKKMQEGPLAATAEGATVNSSSPAAALPSLTAPVPAAVAAAEGTLGGDDRV
uniref:Malectin-like domain-containing protein n=1 Tax=Tetradesmus obliquus TaxID=3088 RepID=A0A383WD12_TETOB|eukprot:jgi/Sobl393_1/5943/SZX75508.1